MSGAILFIEAPGFTKVVQTYFGNDEGYALFQSALAERPTHGDVIPGVSPLRKIRWGAAGKAAGKRGGLRVIYLYIPEVSVIFLLDAYGKNEVDDLSPSDKKILSGLARELADELRRRYDRPNMN